MKRLCEHAFRVAGKLLGFALVCTASTLITGSVYVYVTLVLPTYVCRDSDSCSIHRFATLFLAVNVLFNYAACVLTSPGIPDVPHLMRYVAKQPEDDALDNGTTWKMCHKCKNIKPPRTHHCGICNRCVLNMDHHCPWVNNCIGFLNYRHFILFLFYLWAGCFYGASTLLRPWTELPEWYRMNIPLEYSERGALALLFPLSICIMLSVGLLLVVHCYLIFSAQTTIEMYKNWERSMDAKERREKFKNPFSTGSLWGNFEQVTSTIFLSRDCASSSMIIVQVFHMDKRHLLLAFLPTLGPPARPRIPIFIDDSPEESRWLVPRFEGDPKAIIVTTRRSSSGPHRPDLRASAIPRSHCIV
jgi:hypothetical protein